MKTVLTIKNLSKMKTLKSDDMVLYDGKNWYVTTKEAIFKEYQEKVDKELAALKKEKDDLKASNDEFQLNVAKQINEMSSLIEQLVLNKGVK